VGRVEDRTVAPIHRKEGKQTAAVLALLLIAVLFGVGVAVKALLWVAIVLLVLWALGFAFRPAGRRWYYW